MNAVNQALHIVGDFPWDSSKAIPSPATQKGRF